ncbi:MAG TPA: type II toxin-antitoxin system VapC family toxin [Candidatus Binataceae bacterium]
MKALDTNVLLRYLLRDDPAQARTAKSFIDRECSAEAPGFINRIVLCETVWVLERGYSYSRDAVYEVLGNLLLAQQLAIEDRDEALAALREYREGADFSDSMIAAINRRLGCEYTATFDQKAGRREGFRLL